MTFARWVFRAAAIYGFATLVPLYFLEAAVAAPSPQLSHPEYFYGFIGVSLAAQVMFLTIAADPARYRPMMIPAFLEKISFAIPVLVLYAKNRTSTATLAFGLVDLTLGALFIAAYIRTGGWLAKQTSYE